VFNEIQRLKQQRYKDQKSIQVLKKAISRARFEKFVRNKAITFRSSLPEASEPRKHIVSRNERYIGKVKNMRLYNEGDNPNGFTFSGTDNGIVTMTETVGFCIDRFKYHLALHNRYSPLATETSEDQQPLPFFPLPVSMKINSADVDFGGGYWRQRKKLEKKKKLSPEGRQVTDVERFLSRAASESTRSIQDVVAVHRLKKENKGALQQFYHSNQQANQGKNVTLTNKRFRDRLCSTERKAVKVDKSLVMFIGDRGTGVGSTIRGHRRYGGKWKQKIHGRNTTVCIIKEHKTSQTCVYCFSPVIHPPKVRGG
jgi:hypothetical protein